MQETPERSGQPPGVPGSSGGRSGGSGGRSGGGGSGGGSSDRRQLRPRATRRSYVDQHPQLDALLGAEEEDEEGGAARRRLNIPLLCHRVERGAPAATLAPASHPSQLTGAALAAAGLRQPLLVPGGAAGRGGVAATCAALGLQLPPAAQLTPEGLAAAVGPSHQVPTIDVATQDSGPRLTLRQLAAYLRQQQEQQQEEQQAFRQQGQREGAPQRLLNVVSLSLADTPLEVRAWHQPPCRLSPAELGVQRCAAGVNQQAPVRTPIYCLGLC
jgi:hypothetical protein